MALQKRAYRGIDISLATIQPNNKNVCYKLRSHLEMTDKKEGMGILDDHRMTISYQSDAAIKKANVTLDTTYGFPVERAEY